MNIQANYWWGQMQCSPSSQNFGCTPVLQMSFILNFCSHLPLVLFVYIDFMLHCVVWISFMMTILKTRYFYCHANVAINAIYWSMLALLDLNCLCASIK